MHDPLQRAWFFAATVDDNVLNSIKLSYENSGWQLMKINDFLTSVEVVPLLKPRLIDYLDHAKS